MTSSSRSFLQEAGLSDRPQQKLKEGMDNYVQAFLGIVNQANVMDIPLVVAALKAVESCITNSDLYTKTHGEDLEKLITRLISPRFAMRKVTIPKSVIDILEGRGEL